MKTRDEIRDDLPLYALGALEPAERAAVEAALAAGDTELVGELSKWTELIGLVALEAPEAAPPDMRVKLLSRVRASAVSAPRSTKVARRRIAWSVPVVVAAAAVLALAGYREIGLRAERARSAETVRALERTLAVSRADLAESAATLAERQEDVETLRAALARTEGSPSISPQQGLHMVSLKDSTDAQPVEGKILLSPFSGRALFYAFNLPKVAPDKAYQLWWITDQAGAVPAAVFRADERGRGGVEAPTPGGMIRAAAVTVEAAGGAMKPNGPMVLLGTVPVPGEEFADRF